MRRFFPVIDDEEYGESWLLGSGSVRDEPVHRRRKSKPIRQVKRNRRSR